MDDLTQALVKLAAAAVTAATPVLVGAAVYAVRAYLDAHQNSRLVGAAARAAGLINDYLREHADDPNVQAVKAAAWEAGLAYMRGGTVGAVVAAAGLSPERVADMVRGQLGSLPAPAVASKAMMGEPLPPLPGWTSEQVARLLGAPGGTQVGQGA